MLIKQGMRQNIEKEILNIVLYSRGGDVRESTEDYEQYQSNSVVLCGRGQPPKSHCKVKSHLSPRTVQDLWQILLSTSSEAVKSAPIKFN